MVSWWVTYSYSNNKQIKISNVELMYAMYGSSGSFWPLVRSNYIVYNIYTGINSNLSSKATSIHGPAHKSDLNYLYSRSHFSQLPQVSSKDIINRLYHKYNYTSTKIDPVINEFSPNEVKSHLHIFDHSSVNIGIRGFCIGF